MFMLTKQLAFIGIYSVLMYILHMVLNYLFAPWKLYLNTIICILYLIPFVLCIKLGLFMKPRMYSSLKNMFLPRGSIKSIFLWIIIHLVGNYFIDMSKPGNYVFLNVGNFLIVCWSS